MKKVFKYISIFNVLWGVLTLLFYFSNPSDIENQFFLGLSIQRWLLVIIVLFSILLSLYSSISIENEFASFQSLIEKWHISYVQATRLWFLITIFLFISVLLSFLPVLPHPYFIARLRPLLLYWLIIMSTHVLHSILIEGHKPWHIFSQLFLNIKKLALVTENKIQKLSTIFNGHRFLIPMLLFVFPLVFYVPFNTNYPVGYAGLYTLMAKEIIAKKFLLPTFIPYYGPGGIPFAYPPFASFVMAIVLSIFNTSDMFYLRFVPALFYWLSLIPLALIVFQMTKSRVAASIAMLVLATSHRVYMIQGTAGGSVRGLAFLLALFGIYFYLTSMKTEKFFHAVIAGIFFGLTILSHLSYAEFAFFFVIAYGLTHLNSRKTWLQSTVTGIVTLLVIAPWVITIVQRHGWLVFEHAFHTHGSDYFISLFQSPEKLIPWFENTLRPVYNMRFLWGMIIIGLILSLTKYPVLTIWFSLILVFVSEGDRYIITCGAILIGILIDALMNSYKEISTTQKGTRRSLAFFAIFVLIFYQYGWQSFKNTEAPKLTDDSMSLASFIKTHTEKDDQYLLVAEAGEAEWYPYLLQRKPVAASWGGEWIGSYRQHMGYLLDIHECEMKDSMACLDDVIALLPYKPDLLITHSYTTEINKTLREEGLWETIYENNLFIVWQKE